MENRQNKRMSGCDNNTDNTFSSAVDPVPVGDHQTHNSVIATFNQPHLLEMIMDLAFRNNKPATNLLNKQSFRLVTKSWNQALTNLWRKSEYCLFKLKINENNSLLGTPFVTENGKTLDQFVTYWTTESRADNTMPTFQLSLEKEYFRQENYNSLYNCFRKCGNGLVKLEMALPQNGGSLTGILSNIALSALKELNIKFLHSSLENLDLPDRDLYNPCNVTFLLQSVLNKTEKLKQLVFTCDCYLQLHSFPGVQYIPLPESLTKIKIDLKCKENVLELLAKNHLPQLQYLTLGVICVTSNSAELLFQIFGNVRKTLRYLGLSGYNYDGPPRVPNLLRFPVMEKLHILEIYSIFFELATQVPAEQDLFPKLNKLILYEQTPIMLQKWTTGSPCSTVKTLAFELVDEHESAPGNTLPLPLHAIQSVNLKFPNVRRLTLKIFGKASSAGLKYIFMEMRQLTSLHIFVVGTESISSSHFWDSVLIGAPKKFLKGLSACPGFWNQVKLENGEEPSIRMLEGLKTFSLKQIATDDDSDSSDDDSDDSSDDGDFDEPLISNLAFVYAFLKMPNLRSLHFNGRFKASEEMTSEWKKLGRKIKYSE